MCDFGEWQKRGHGDYFCDYHGGTLECTERYQVSRFGGNAVHATLRGTDGMPIADTILSNTYHLARLRNRTWKQLRADARRWAMARI